MSACISSAGEFGSHVLDDAYSCTRCFVLDEDALTAELLRLRAAIKAVQTACTVADETDLTDWQRGYRAAALFVRGALDGAAMSS